jgi:predicted amidophosphoribosyltransferase
MLTALRRIKELLLDVLYPPFCVACGARGSWWCASCRDHVELLKGDPCPRCLKTEPDHDTGSCEGHLPFRGVVSTGYYHSKPLRRFIAEVKYKGVTAGEREVEAYLAQFASKRALPFPWSHEQNVFIQALPLAAPRERDRGFNQAAWIAERFRRTWLPDAKIIRALDRRPSDMTQASLENKALRSMNVRGEFVAVSRISGAVILVDDVVTTGSTAAEAAHTLIRAGASAVYLASLALGK